MHTPRLFVFAFVAGLLATLIVSAGASEKLAGFAEPAAWNIDAAGDVTVQPGPDHTMRLQAVEGTAQKRTVELTLRQPVAIPDAAIRTGLWIYIRQPIAFNGQWMIVEDAAGRRFEYTLPNLPSTATGWHYVDTYPFTANEIGRLHPQVGRPVDGGIGLPHRPLKFSGLRMEIKPASRGEILLSDMEADSYALGSGQWHWALTEPGPHYWLDTGLLRSDESPYLLAGALLPKGGDADVTWQVVAGFQGPVVHRGSARLKFDADDIVAQAQRLPLGDLPAGNYQVCVDQRVHDLRQGSPTGWNRLIWRAQGVATWDDADPADAAAGKRYMRGHKDGGEGYVGWRQTPQVAGPGEYRFHVSARGDGKPEVRIVPMDAKRNSIGKVFVVHFDGTGDWESRDEKLTLPENVDRVYVDIVATQPGDASFDGLSLTKDGREMLANGSAEEGRVLEQKVFPLVVVSSLSKAAYPVATSWTVDAGQPFDIAWPAWKDEPGDKRWRITDASGDTLAEGAATDQPIRWTPMKPGVYECRITRKIGDLLMDVQTLKFGCRTPADQLGDAKFTLHDSAATEADMFGPGHNYFTWSMYEYHPENPEFFDNCKRWIADGRKADFTLFRLRIDWSYAEPLPGVFDFSMTDRLVAEVIRQGGRVVLEPICRTPAWLPISPQLNNFGRADVMRRDLVTGLPSIWTPGMLDRIKQFTQAVVLRYRNNPDVVGYHLWGLPGSVDWTTQDRPWWGQSVDYSPAALAAFNRWSKHVYTQPPMASQDWSKPDLSEQWRDWIAFRRYGLEHFFLDNVLKPLRELDDRRPVISYFGLDFASRAMTESTRTLHWRRHTGGCELYYQVPMQAMRAMFETGRDWPEEVHYMTPLAPALEQATFQISATGGGGFNWNYYWRTTIPVGSWTADREAGLVEWQNIWRPMWRQMRDAALAQQPDVAGITTWSTMHFGVRSFFPLRLGDYATRTAAAMYRDQLWPTWFSENAPFDTLDQLKLIVVTPGAAQVMPAMMADALAKYVHDGGHIVLFPSSGKWVIEEPNRTDALLHRLGWNEQLATPVSTLQTSDLGNSGLPPLPGSDQVVAAHVDEHATMLAADQPLGLQHAVKLPAGNYQVQAKFDDGSPALVTWTFGKGSVALVAGTPDWANTPGLMAGFYRWAGGRRDVGTNLPFVEINHLRKGDVHYVILHRLPDSFRPQFPMPYADLDRQKLHDMQPAAAAVWHLDGLPAGQWRVTELTAAVSSPSDAAAPIVRSSEQLAEGLPIPMYLSQTRVLRIEPVQ